MKQNSYWYKLDEYNRTITDNILKRLPSDCGFSRDDVSGQVNSTFISLIHNYKDAPNGLSITSYCWKYAEQYTYRDLMREYRRAKDNLQLSSIESPEEDEEGNIHHQYGTYQIEPYTPISDHLDVSDTVGIIISKATQEDRQIMRMIMDGYSMDHIGKVLGMSKMAVLKRLRKYGNVK